MDLKFPAIELPAGVLLMLFGVIFILIPLPGFLEMIAALLGKSPAAKGLGRGTRVILFIFGGLFLSLGLMVILGNSLPPSVAPTTTDSAEVSQTAGKPAGEAKDFQVYPNYDPSGYMGDIGDLKTVKGPDSVQFIYEVCGRGAHEWEYKYIEGELNPNPAKFAGVMYLDPPGNFGTSPSGGYDLRGYHKLHWEARSLEGEATVEFVIGGIDWVWNSEHQRESAPYPCSMPRDSLGVYTLTTAWQEFDESLVEHDEDDFERVVGGFGWVAGWDSNGITVEKPGSCAEQPAKIQIEIRNLRYER